MQQSGMNEVKKEYLDFEDDNPLLSKVIERNIRTIIRLRPLVVTKKQLLLRCALLRINAAQCCCYCY